MANNIDPDRMKPKEISYQGMHCLLQFLAHLAHSAQVSFWDRAMSVVRRRHSCVVRYASIIFLNIFFSKITVEKVIKLCIDVPKLVPYINCSNRFIP